MFKNYLKAALRNIARYKSYSFINIAGLSLGMVCCILILLWVQHELSFDRFHKKADNLYRVIVNYPESFGISVPWALGPMLKKDYPEVVSFARIKPLKPALKFGDTHFYEEGFLVDEDFFSMFTFPFVKGNPRGVFPGINSIVISEKLARKYFGNEDPIGKMMNINNVMNAAVRGVIKNAPSNSHLQFDFLMPIRILGEQILNSWAYDSYTYILIKDNVSLEDFTNKIAGTITKYDKRIKLEASADLIPFTRFHLFSLSLETKLIVYIFSAIALIILLIACINFTNLSTTRFSYRIKEVGVRKILGAARTDLIRQFFGESLIMSFIAMMISIALVLIFLPGFNILSGKQLSLDLSGNIWHLLVLILIIIVIGVVSGSYTALFLSSFKPANILKGTQTPGSGHNLVRKILTISQFTCTVILLIGATVVVSQLHYIQTKYLGFEREHIVIVNMNYQIRQKYDTIKTELLKNQNIYNVTAASSMPMYIENSNPVNWEGKTLDRDVSFNFAFVDYNFFETLNIKIVEGRDFSKKFPTDNQNYIVNEEAVKFMEMKEPIGKFFSFWKDKGNIIGVAKSFHNRGFHFKSKPMAFRLGKGMMLKYLFAKINPLHIKSTLNNLVNTIKKLAPDFPIEYSFLDETFGKQYLAEKRIANLFKFFTFFALLISCLGLYGLISFLAEQKTREMGIRMVYGASPLNIVTLLSKEFVKWIALANIIGLPIAYYLMSKWLENYAYHPNMGIWIFIIPGIISLLITVLTVGYQAFKAAAVNPVDSLRYE